MRIIKTVLCFLRFVWRLYPEGRISIRDAWLISRAINGR